MGDKRSPAENGLHPALISHEAPFGRKSGTLNSIHLPELGAELPGAAPGFGEFGVVGWLTKGSGQRG